VPQESSHRGRKVEAVRGTQDVLPEDAGRWREAERRARELLLLYGYSEIRTPVFEHAELFRRPLGEGSDVVAKEMYEFSDKGGRQLALRPEATASIVRAFVEHGLYARGARTKLFSIGPIFRYDRPQTGRLREHYQLSVEAFGNPEPSQDAELIDLGSTVMAALGIGGWECRLNSNGCGECHPAFIAALKAFLVPLKASLCRDCAGYRLEHNVLRVLDCKEEGCRALTEKAPDGIEYLCAACAAHQSGLEGHLGVLGIEWKRDRRLVRGFDYYTRTVFEFVPPGKGQQGTLLGGGRYDGLVELLGGPPTPGAGFGMGMERVLAASAITEAPVPELVHVVAMEKGDALFRAALSACRDLRKAGFRTELGQEGKSANSRMRAANSAGARAVVLVAASGLTVKDMKGEANLAIAAGDGAGLVRALRSVLSTGGI